MNYSTFFNLMDRELKLPKRLKENYCSQFAVFDGFCKKAFFTDRNGIFQFKKVHVGLQGRSMIKNRFTFFTSQ
jgi:hypothetical protein